MKIPTVSKRFQNFCIGTWAHLRDRFFVFHRFIVLFYRFRTLQAQPTFRGALGWYSFVAALFKCVSSIEGLYILFLLLLLLLQFQAFFLIDLRSNFDKKRFAGINFDVFVQKKSEKYPSTSSYQFKRHQKRSTFERGFQTWHAWIQVPLQLFCFDSFSFPFHSCGSVHPILAKPSEISPHSFLFSVHL